MRGSAGRVLFRAWFLSSFVLLAILATGCAESAESADSSMPETLDLPAVASVPRSAGSLSVVAAYEAIPHRRTEFDFSASDINQIEKQYLELAFRVVEEATRTRVSLLRALYHDGSSNQQAVERDLERGEEIADFWRLVPAPEALGDYHRDIETALDNQLRFFRDWSRAGAAFPYKGRSLARAPDVRRSSQALHRAYDRLMKRYPSEVARNRDAFFDYHCALDFL